MYSGEDIKAETNNNGPPFLIIQTTTLVFEFIKTGNSSNIM